MLKRCYMIQRMDGDQWVNYSCHYFITPLEKVLRQYAASRRAEPGKRFRIVKLRAHVDPLFFKE